VHLLLIGASTGGPGLIENLVKNFKPEHDRTMIIAQHMDTLSLRTFANRLSRIWGDEVIFLSQSASIRERAIYLLSDTVRLSQRKGGKIVAEIDLAEKSFYHPTIDVLFDSAATLDETAVTAILLSGIGSDGVKGMHSLKKRGHRTIAQDEQSSIVYGMPKQAYEQNAAKERLSFNRIIDVVKGIV
jgi:two-component system chemotaxis response regulator CheB